MSIQEDIIKACTKSYLIYGKKSYQDNAKLSEFYKKELPSQRQLENLKIHGHLIKIIQNENLDIDNYLGVWKPSFCSVLFDAGILKKRKGHCFYICKKCPQELLNDFKEIKLFSKVITIPNGTNFLHGAHFLNYMSKSDKINEIEYLAGLFASSSIISINNEQCYLISPKNNEKLTKITNILKKYQILYQINKNGEILISPFYGALFYKYMPIHSASRVIGVKNAYLGAELALVYWDMVRNIGEPTAPIKAQILPYSLSYASYWNRDIIKKDIRRMGIEMGILGIHPEIRKLIKEWMTYMGYN